MSAVGLMLLEDPKARARAEARIRNGTAKRRSFFGRSSAAAAPPPGQARRVPNLPPTIPDEDGEDDSPIVRPSTSLSQTIALPGRKKTESTSDRSSSRNSTIFGRKNSLGESSIRSGSSGRASQLSGVASSYSRDQIGHEEEYRPQMRKPAALPPSQSQHLSHPTKAALQPLEVADENDMQVKFWAKSKYAKPKVQVNGVKAEDWATTQPDLESDRECESTLSPALSPIDPNPPRIPAAARMSLFDDTIFNDVKENSLSVKIAGRTPPTPRDGARPLLDPKEGSRSQEPARHTSRVPKQYSTMVARNSLMFPEEPILQTPGAERTGDPLDSHGQDELHLPQMAAGVHSRRVESFETMSKAVTAQPVAQEHQGSTYPSRQASLPVPERRPAPKGSESSLGSSSNNSNSSRSPVSLDVPVERTVIVDPASPSRLSSSTGKSPALSFSSNVRESTVFADSNWEDDIDFAYEEGADATCDFDWDTRGRNHVSSFLSDGGVRLSASYGSRTPSLYSDVSHDSRPQNDSRRDSRGLSTGATIAERRESQNTAENARGYSVGHRGFAAARNSTGDKLAKSAKLSSLSIPAPSSQGDALSPVDSITDSGDETPKSPLTPSKLEFPMPPGTSDSLEFPMPPGNTDQLGALDFPMPPSANKTRDSNSSDLDSWYSGSKHRKSSSYGSYEGFRRASTAPSTAPSSAPSSRDTGRWSMASASSVPSVPTLIPGHYKRTSSLSKPNGSPPLEPLVQLPEEEKLASSANGASVPHILQADQERESFVMRRPRTSGDRRLLQAAGRAVQGRAHRPTTPNSSSRGPQVHETYVGRIEPLRVAPEWI